MDIYDLFDISETIKDKTGYDCHIMVSAFSGKKSFENNIIEIRFYFPEIDFSFQDAMTKQFIKSYQGKIRERLIEKAKYYVSRYKNNPADAV